MYLNFGTLKETDLDFLSKRIISKKCPDCQRKASIKITEEGISHIENICCEKYAKIIGNSISIRNINEYAISFRGVILNDFCLLEKFIDQIIEFCVILYPDEFSLEDNFELQMREKKLYFQKCLDLYTIFTSNNITKIWGNFCNILETRNHLAHWPVDTSKNGVSLLLKKNKIRFLNSKKTEKTQIDDFDHKKVSKIQDSVKKNILEIINVYNYFELQIKNK
jgi:Zn ribbon nucleic-acid-binding protein